MLPTGKPGMRTTSTQGPAVPTTIPLGVVVDLMSEVRAGRIPSSHAAVEVVDEMRDLVLQDPNALLGMAMMKAYDDYTFHHSVNVSIFSLALAHPTRTCSGRASGSGARRSVARHGKDPDR